MKIKPQVHVTLQDDGSVSIEYSVNGQRQVKHMVSQGEIYSALREQEQAIIAQAERAAALESEREERRRVKNWNNVCFGVSTPDGLGHGPKLATHCFGKRFPQRSREDRINQSVGADASAIPGTADML